MEVKILDTKQEGSATCYLTKFFMSEYLENLPDDYRDWNVQRGIVTNHYLDKIIDTLLQSKHIPPLVLITDNVNASGDKAQLESFQVLDGLQRTHRLKLIHNSVNFIKNTPEIIEESKIHGVLKSVRKHSKSITENNATSPVVRKLLSEIESGNSIDNLFEFEQWAEVWENLSLTEQVNKMLLLNAGHKSVSKKHQIEIIFHNIISKLENELEDKFTIVRERNVSSISANKNRPVGQFSFSHIVSGMMSLDQGKPVTINANLLSKVQEDIDNYTLSYDEILELCSFLADLDSSLFNEYNDIGLKWLGKEVVVTGLLGAVGIYAEKHGISTTESLNITRNKLIPNPSILSLNNYDDIRNGLDVSKINIGKVNKSAVTNAITDLLEAKVSIVDWNNAFSGGV
ncbi:hypothetical protein ACEH99_004237 [Vibrio vulnificus]|nr:hypothetical protein [Vibrio vulnificus]MCU8137635.1 hypothetical protein [Vibrio vulnificus]